MTHHCKDCHSEMSEIEQENLRGELMTLVTCENVQVCDLAGQTFEVGRYARLTAAELESYRKSGANYRRHLAQECANS